MSSRTELVNTKESAKWTVRLSLAHLYSMKRGILMCSSANSSKVTATCVILVFARAARKMRGGAQDDMHAKIFYVDVE